MTKTATFFFLILLSGLICLTANSRFASAEDEFGNRFTQNEPAALADSDRDFSAEALSTIEPAAGGDVFTLSPDTETETDEKGILAAPSSPPVPGMDVNPAAVVVPSPAAPSGLVMDSSPSE